MFPHNSGAYSNFRKCELNNGLPNFFKVLKKEGYVTAMMGKCHFAPVPYDDASPEATLLCDDFKEYYMRLGIDHDKPDEKFCEMFDLAEDPYEFTNVARQDKYLECLAELRKQIIDHFMSCFRKCD